MYRFRVLVVLVLVQMSDTIVETVSNHRASMVAACINYGLDCVVTLWEGPQLLLAKVKDAIGRIGIFNFRSL